MLVLSRQKGESIYIGDDISVKVIRIRGTQVELGIEAPQNVGILRSELDKLEQAIAGDSGVPGTVVQVKRRADAS